MLSKKRFENRAHAEKIYEGNAENSDLSFEEFRIDLFTVYAAILSSGQSDSK